MIKFSLTLIFLLFFVFIIVHANTFSKETETVYVNPNFIEEWEIDRDYINLENISVEITEWQEWIIKYTVQAWDSLSRIAGIFWVTVWHLQKSNSLSNNSPIRPGQVKVITSKEQGLLYNIPEDINIKVFTDKYSMSLDDIMAINYIQDESEILKKGNEIFVNITKEEAYESWLLERPIPIYVPKQQTTYKPVVVKNNSYTNPSTTNSASSSLTPSSSNGKIISKRTYNKNISNSFYRWHCTWYTAIISPEFFPYTNDTTQQRTFGGNGNQRYTNAQKAWFSVGDTPMVGSIVSYNLWGANYWYAWHVAKVISYNPATGDFVVEEMNYAWKFIVTRRKDNISNSNIIWFIYPK